MNTKKVILDLTIDEIRELIYHNAGLGITDTNRLTLRVKLLEAVLRTVLEKK